MGTPVDVRVGQREQRVDQVAVPGVLQVDGGRPAGAQVVADRDAHGRALVGRDHVLLARQRRHDVRVELLEQAVRHPV
jgi:hypothetical protein